MRPPGDTPRDVVLTVCRDEADVIEAFIRFHLDMGFDAVYVVDNGSRDSTPKILEGLVEEGLSLVWKSDTRPGYDLHLTEHYHWAGAAAKPRWLFFLDVDEFIHFPDGAKAYLDAVSNDITALRLLQRQIYQSTSQSFVPSKWSFLYANTAGTTFDDEPSKVVTRYSTQARVLGGKHRIDFPGAHEKVPTDLYIRHYKYRSADQARTKEENRIASEAVFTDEEIQTLSAFPWEQTKLWMGQSRLMASREEWRTWFSPVRPLATDDVIARWAQAHTGASQSTAIAETARSSPIVPLPPASTERLLALETLRQITASPTAAAPTVGAVAVSTGLAEYLRRYGGGITAIREFADLDAVGASRLDTLLLGTHYTDESPRALACKIAERLQSRSRALAPYVPAEAEAFIAELRSTGLQAMRFGIEQYGVDAFTAYGIDVDDALLVVMPHVRPENGALAQSPRVQ